MYEDLRDQIHPKVAMAIPDTPEATAILQNECIKPLTFGGLTTKLVEQGVVDAATMDDVRAGVSELLGIDETEFNERLKDSSVLDKHMTARWIEDYDQRVRDRLVSEKEGEAKSYFDSVVMSHLGDSTNLDKLQPRIDELRPKVADWEAQISEAASEDRPLYLLHQTMHIKMSLERYKPELEALEGSAYAISLADFIDILRQDQLMLTHDRRFKSEAIDDFAGFLRGLPAHFPDTCVLSLFTDGPEHTPGEILECMQNTWLNQNEVALFARAYANTYYSPFISTSPGRAEVEALQNPLRDIFIVSDEERTAFFEAYPLANGAKSKR